MKYISSYRIIVIVFMSVKFFLQIYFFQRTTRTSREKEKRWNKLLEKQAEEYKRKALHLEGLMIKMGQFLSTRADLMPPEFLDQLASLADRVPPVSWDACRKLLKDEWNMPYKEVVKDMDTKPVASASIGQVYKGTLYGGEEVAIKIRRPKIERIVNADFKALRIVLWLAKHFTKLEKRTDLKKMYREIREVMGDELNFISERKNGESFKRKYQELGTFNIPSFYEEWCTDKVLVMEWVEGKRITDTAFISNFSLDGTTISEQLLRGFLDQVLEEGLFHADPHPGNILLGEDGTITLLDFGMAASLKQDDAAALRQLVSGFIFDDYDEVIEALEKLGFLLPEADHEALKHSLRDLIDTFFNKGQNMPEWDERLVESFIAELQRIAREQPIHLPSEFAFLGRAVSTLTGVLYAINPQLDLIQSGRPIVMDWLRGRPEANIQTFIKEAASTYGNTLLHLPQELSKFLKEPERKRLDEAKQFSIRQSQENLRQMRSFFLKLILLGSAGFMISMWVSVLLTVYISILFVVIGGIGACATTYKLKQHTIVRSKQMK
ncbi:ABC1 kinase family protein [Salsuginibacillus kocurii]|uniref:ABC1 kinase family protein n=1 Tax=Salsuginibacillus kocurii TaxID=427078 RepID=UPI00146DDD38|nr:AarF/UbiB family protein [Salsuginibacillus kocurii]